MKVSKNETDIQKKLLREIKQVPPEFLPALLTIVHSFRESVAFDSAANSFERGWKEISEDDLKPIEDLWQGLEY
ncbi:hypothetical protein [Endozoicomonas sp. 4G]|uniref:hypothetical protein n=1 Tax=Endozoicomonas sp. 4G TaxID=2872754 RepID=UPI0020788F86|nr:hypothetical protein [Endozoicomonas sp. 4G]